MAGQTSCKVAAPGYFVEKNGSVVRLVNAGAFNSSGVTVTAATATSFSFAQGGVGDGEASTTGIATATLSRARVDSSALGYWTVVDQPTARSGSTAAGGSRVCCRDEWIYRAISMLRRNIQQH